MITTLYKHQDGQTLVVTGYLSKFEVNELLQQGYRQREPNVNKHGIPVCRKAN